MNSKAQFGLCNETRRHTLFCLVVGGYIANSGEKNLEVHLIIIGEWPNPLISKTDSLNSDKHGWKVNKLMT